MNKANHARVFTTMNAITVRIITLFTWLIPLPWLLTAPTNAAAKPLQFEATAKCPLFQSKNKQSNPGSHYTQPGHLYPMIGRLGPAEAPTWVRLRTTISPSPERWVNGNCGIITDAPPGANLTTVDVSPKGCTTPGQYDSHILALSLQNAFCELGNRTKKECIAITGDGNHPAHRQFSLHGLWPNKQECGREYGYCGSVSGPPGDFCDYPALNLIPATQKQLHPVMPSAQFGSCLERHEYWKHGTCLHDSPNVYFQTSAKLATEVNQSTFVTDFIKPNIGKMVRQADFRQAFENSFGPGATGMLDLKCSKNLLVEIQIKLPASLDGSLPQLLRRAGKTQKSTCPDNFRLDERGYEK